MSPSAGERRPGRALKRGAGAFLALAAALAAAPAGAQGGAVVSGRAVWMDEHGDPHPVRFAPVQVWDARAAVQVGPNVPTDSAGRFEVALPAAGRARDLYARVLSLSPAARVRPVGVSLEYEIRSATRGGVTDADRVELALEGSGGTAPNDAFSVLDAVGHGHAYASTLPDARVARVEVLYPADRTFYDSAAAQLEVREGDRWDWDVVLHEYGHYVAHGAGISALPAGEHLPWDSLAKRYEDKEFGIALAWSEGWATFFSISAQVALGLRDAGLPRVGDPRYSDTEDIFLSYSLADQSDFPSVSEDSEGTVARVLFDLYDPPDGGGDPAEVADTVLWGAFAAGRAQTLSAAWLSLAGRVPRDEASRAAAVLAAHFVAPAASDPADGAPLEDAPPTFRWLPQGGWLEHDRFVIEVFDASGARLWTSAELTGSSYTPTADEWSRVRAPGGEVWWVVHASNSLSPATGPYTSPARRLVPRP